MSIFKPYPRDAAFNKKLRSLVLPITLQNFMFALVPVSDAMMLVALDQDAMSAVNLAAQVNFVLNLFIFAICSGTALFAAQYWGANDRKSIEKLYGYAIKLTIPVVLFFYVAARFFGNPVMHIFATDSAIIKYGAEYLGVVALAYIFNSFNQVIEIILKNTGLIKICTIISVSMVVANVMLNAVFIYGLLGAPAMGAGGAALATTISGGLGLVALVIVQLTKAVIPLKVKNVISTSADMRKTFWKYSAPYLGNQMSWGIGFTMISVIMGHLGSDAVAANSVVVVAKDLVSCFCFAVGSGGAIMVGNELGAGRLEKGKEYGGRLSWLAATTGVATGVLLAIAAFFVPGLLNISDKAAHYLFWMLIMCVYYMFGRSMNSTVIAGIFAAGGDTKFGFICDTITMWAFIVPVGALAAFVLKLPVLAVFFILNLDEMIKLPAVYIHYKKYKWVKNLSKEGVSSEA